MPPPDDEDGVIGRLIGLPDKLAWFFKYVYGHRPLHVKAEEGWTETIAESRSYTLDNIFKVFDKVAIGTLR